MYNNFRQNNQSQYAYDSRDGYDRLPNTQYSDNARRGSLVDDNRLPRISCKGFELFLLMTIVLVMGFSILSIWLPILPFSETRLYDLIDEFFKSGADFGKLFDNTMTIGIALYGIACLSLLVVFVSWFVRISVLLAYKPRNNGKPAPMFSLILIIALAVYAIVLLSYFFCIKSYFEDFWSNNPNFDAEFGLGTGLIFVLVLSISAIVIMLAGIVVRIVQTSGAIVVDGYVENNGRDMRKALQVRQPMAEPSYNLPSVHRNEQAYNKRNEYSTPTQSYDNYAYSDIMGNNYIQDDYAPLQDYYQYDYTYPNYAYMQERHDGNYYPIDNRYSQIQPDFRQVATSRAIRQQLPTSRVEPEYDYGYGYNPRYRRG
ncbi:MAG: hypothetical protein FWF56_04195 [Firmicutes bacterium]|nr:hypothetical protein [Bacillota bacterium]MCL1953756.1 hypothetical protein [Bacillota bacterium]